jgi:hypothetical protein
MSVLTVTPVADAAGQERGSAWGTRRRGALVAGAGLLAMAVLGGAANLGVIEPLVAEGDAALTASQVLESEGLFRAATAAMFVMALLDVLVAWGLLTFFRAVDEPVSALAAWLRVAYAAGLVAAIGHLTAVPRLAAGGRADEALAQASAFDDLWMTALGVFGVHLLVLAYLAWVAPDVPRWLGVLLAVAGAGYVADTAGTMLVPGYSVSVTAVTFAGEVLLMVWLLVRGRTL